MAVRDDVKEQKLKMKDMSFKEKLKYFWYYYKIHTIITIIVVAAVTSFIVEKINSKPYGFYGVFVNAVNLDSDDFADDFGEVAGIDLEEYDCFIDSSSVLSYNSMSDYDLATAQRLIALVSTGDLDVMTADSIVFLNYTQNEMYADLRTLYTDEELAAYEGNIYYIEESELTDDYDDEEDVITTDEVQKLSDEEIKSEAETHRHPENMESPVPVGFYLDNAEFITSSDSYSSYIPVAGIMVTSKHQDLAKKFIDYMFTTSYPSEN